MNRRLAAHLPLFMLAAWLLGGCASGPDTRPQSLIPANLSSLPQIQLAASERDQVRSLAMGAARSKGWRITQSDPERLLLERPVTPDSTLARVLDLPPGQLPTDTRLEVASYFIDEGTAVRVASAAALIRPRTDQPEPERRDVTSRLQPLLTQSLAALERAWQTHHQRLAEAAPPLPPQPAPSTDGEATPAGTLAAIPAAPIEGSETTQRQPLTAATQTDNPANASRDVRPQQGPAPVIDATPMLREAPPLAPEPPQAQTQMLSLTPQQRDVTWAAYAEQYARLRGCVLTDEGAVLIDNRSDGEIHKVPCEGTDSILVQCHDGLCRGLL
ncbi:hypothetical protein [Marichromatium gracile]|uniref:Uncharacterized protein n=1 Tax=Marichromatium gracile TaxID=1048 RepID=A0A4R4ADC3_MARGR|nr:hypothetical protein [Marichromatium gracile]MBK1709186.1 hypothetical protein [Marichromatium gracile]TCW37081.1 hypothetical protein EDC29_103278 [Marichromatium gracile]